MAVETTASGAVSDRAILGRLVRFNAWTKEHVNEIVIGVIAWGLLRPQHGMALKRLRFLEIPGVHWAIDLPTLALALVVLSASVRCEAASWKGLLSRSRAGWITLGGVFAVIPIVAFIASLIARTFLEGRSNHELQMGFVFVAVMPVAVSSSFWVRVNRGFLPLVLALAVVGAGAAALTIPAYLHLIIGSAPSMVRVPVGDLARQLILAVAIPVVVGAAANARPGLAQRWEPALSALGTLGFLAVALISAAGAKAQLAATGDAFVSALILTFLCNLVCFWAGIRMARYFGLWREDAIALVYASGMRDHGVAMAVGASSFAHMPLVTLPAAILGVTQHVIAAFLSRSFSRPDGGLLGPAIGSDARALEGYLTDLYGVEALRTPSASVAVFHISGDADLRAIVAAVRGALRSSDYVCALSPGGFAVLLAGAADHHVMVYERTLKRVGERFPGLDLRWSGVHSSGYRQPADLLKDVFARADSPAADRFTAKAGA
ncbi:MAG: bile acid:sodium symporter [Elusimicrobia bacterium]|nr:bile acid:sodium symporter [Elusimicrobiota bacterium]